MVHTNKQKITLNGTPLSKLISCLHIVLKRLKAHQMANLSSIRTNVLTLNSSKIMFKYMSQWHTKWQTSLQFKLMS